MNLLRKKGFTLIELLVVIAVIGALATTITISIKIFRANSRDGVRLVDVKQLAMALDYYRDDHGSYPDCNTCQDESTWDTCLKTALAEYMENIPKDPISKAPYKYCYFKNLDAELLDYYGDPDSSHFAINFFGQSVIKFTTERENTDLDDIILSSNQTGVWNYYLILH